MNSSAAKLLIVFSCLLAGCHSFRTTALYRFDNDSVVAECNNEKLKGIPVKLKVPSHVRVTIYEDQVILGNSTTETDAKAKAASDAAEAVILTETNIKGYPKALAAADLEFTDSEKLVEAAQLKLTAAGTDTGKQNTATKLLERANLRLTNALNAQETAATNNAKVDNLRSKVLPLQQAAAELAARDAAIGYTLISFNPAQVVVKTDLEYTDKVFLVDFRRPAGGILDLKGAKMDDEQYFADVQADVTERTMRDVSNAMLILQGEEPKKMPNNATATSAESTGDEQADDVNFEKSILASQRFDISEPDWECRMQAFIDERLLAIQTQLAGAVEVEQLPLAEVEQ